ncbi:MAG: hypothetical protein AB7S63_06515 [Thauera sp.]|jgi:hypothetical protein
MRAKFAGALSKLLAGVVAWVRRHRRLLLILLLLSLFFSVLGYFTSPVSVPGMCKIYG